jgi:hypothetical protein
MTDKDTVALPQNVEEFNAIAGFAFAQLYKAFPARVSINKNDIAHQMGLSVHPDSSLPSGKLFKEVLALTLNWLADEGYVRTSQGEKLVLSEKGLKALNAVPPSIGKPIGSHLRNLSDQPSAVSQIADAVGSLIGGFTKSMSGP